MGLFEDVGNGIYDFASDTLDNIGNIVSELNGMARDNIPIVRDVEDSIHGAYDWGMDQLRSNEAYSKIEKDLERALICTLYVPAKKRAITRIIKGFDKEVKEIGEKTKKTIDSVNNQIDSEIKGEFSTATQDSVNKENLKWEQLV
ncbi:hypothetical protein ACVRXQ_09555 [Streptococcus panodentis]|nr:hypothetical protein [Streptococcus panodentis]MBP2620771.1 hypothetical protein [Streptococcus panodentis]